MIHYKLQVIKCVTYYSILWLKLEGSFMIVTALQESEWMFNYILSFGVDIEVLTPQNIWEMIQNKLDQILEKYKNKEIIT